MDLLGRLFTGTLHAGVPGPIDDYWYNPVGLMTAAGVRIDEEGAKKVSAWFRGRDLLATSLAMLPLGMNVRLPGDGGRDAAPDHPLDDVIGRKPNTRQDAFRWRRQAMYHVIDHGNAYSRIIPGARGFVDQLVPLHPTRVKPQLLDSGRVVYRVKAKSGGTTTTFTQDEIFHLCGACDDEDGVEGKGVLEYARDSLGLGQTLETYASRIFSRGGLRAGVIEVPGTLNEEASKRMAQSFVTATGNWHLPKVLEQGAKFTQDTLDPEKAQMILSRQFTVSDIARWLGVPPHMIGELERSTNNNIEHQGQEFVDYSLGPWLTLFEFSINDQLVTKPQTYYAEFVRDALVRGDIAARWAAYQIAVQTGTYTRNEVRELENKPKLPGLDTPLDPAHLTGKLPAPAGGGSKGPASSSTKAHAIAVESAARLLRKEIAQVERAAVKHAADADAFAIWVTDFYQAHVALVAETLQMSADDAARYCAGQAAQLLGELGLRAVETWGTAAYASGLAAWALEEEVA
jgi:HK97 family phage portal protein